MSTPLDDHLANCDECRVRTAAGWGLCYYATKIAAGLITPESKVPKVGRPPRQPRPEWLSGPRARLNGVRLTELCRERGVQRQDVAAACDINESTLGCWVNGQYSAPLGAIDRIAAYFGVERGELALRSERSVSELTFPVGRGRALG